MSDTPRTDEQINGKPCTRFEVYAGDALRDAWVPSQFARQLERELNAANDRIKRLEEALVKITKEVPAHDGCGGLFLPMFDGDGNEIGVQPVDPIKVIGAMHARALDAISCQCA